MKATARKIKDNEWIAEVEEIGYFEFGMIPVGKKQYPVVSSSDIEWLEKNSMDGKEVEGETQWAATPKPGDIYGPDEFVLDPPPIHSDPAVAADWEKKFNILNEMYTNLLYEKASQPPTPQTGRMYSESEFRAQVAKTERLKVLYADLYNRAKRLSDDLDGYNLAVLAAQSKRDLAELFQKAKS